MSKGRGIVQNETASSKEKWDADKDVRLCKSGALPTSCAVTKTCTTAGTRTTAVLRNVIIVWCAEAGLKSRF